MGKGAGSVSIIGGADGPTSIFIAGKGGKVKLTTRIQNYFRKAKRNRVKKRITANPHTLEELVELLKREYGAVEVSQQSFNYLEQRKSLKVSYVHNFFPKQLLACRAGRQVGICERILIYESMAIQSNNTK